MGCQDLRAALSCKQSTLRSHRLRAARPCGAALGRSLSAQCPRHGSHLHPIMGWPRGRDEAADARTPHSSPVPTRHRFAFCSSLFCAHAYQDLKHQDGVGGGGACRAAGGMGLSSTGGGRGEGSRLGSAPPCSWMRRIDGDQRWGLWVGVGDGGQGWGLWMGVTDLDHRRRSEMGITDRFMDGFQG